MPQALPTFFGVYLHLDLKHQTDEYIYSSSSLRARAEMTQECLFGSGFPYVALCSFSPTFAIAPLESRWRSEHWQKGGSKEEHWEQECFAARGISFLWLLVQCRIMMPFVLAQAVLADGLAMAAHSPQLLARGERVCCHTLCHSQQPASKRCRGRFCIAALKKRCHLKLQRSGELVSKFY